MWFYTKNTTLKDKLIERSEKILNKILIERQEDFNQTRKTSNKIIVVT